MPNRPCMPLKAVSSIVILLAGDLLGYPLQNAQSALCAPESRIAQQVPPSDRLAPASRHQTVPRAAHPQSPADRGGPFRRHLRPPGSHLTRGSETGAPRERGLRSYHELYHKQEGAVKAISKRNPAVSVLPISYFSSSDAFCQ